MAIISCHLYYMQQLNEHNMWRHQLDCTNQPAAAQSEHLLYQAIIYTSIYMNMMNGVMMMTILIVRTVGPKIQPVTAPLNPLISVPLFADAVEIIPHVTMDHGPVGVNVTRAVVVDDENMEVVDIGILLVGHVVQ